MKDNRITLRSLLVGAFFAALFAALSIYINTHVSIMLASAQITVLPFLLLIVMVLFLNPLLRLIKIIRVFSLVELIIIFIMGIISAGIPNFGLVEQIIPLAGSFMSEEWNNPQSEWSRYVEPYIHDAYFLSEPGTRQAAGAYYSEQGKLTDLQLAHKTAERLTERRLKAGKMAETLQSLEQHAKTVGSARSRETAIKRTRLELEALQAEVVAAEQNWESFEERGHLSVEQTLANYPALIQDQIQLVEEAQLALKALESKAFEKVAAFRRGLPRGMSAYPGIFPMPEDDWSSYTARLQRLRQGREALKSVTEARDTAAKDLENSAVLLTAAEKTLAPLANKKTQETRLEAIQVEEQLLSERQSKAEEELHELNARRRQAPRGEALALNNQVELLNGKLAKLQKQRAQIRKARERSSREYDCAHNITELMAKLAALRENVESNQISASAFQKNINELLPDFAKADISLRRYFVGEVPWQIWARPFLRWGILILLTYLALMTLNVLIFRQWAHNEMLTYPLAELPKALVYTDKPGGGMPDVFRNGLFWMGAGISGAVLGWNLLCKSQVVPGLPPLELLNPWSAYVVNTPLQILMSWKSEIFFTMIGLAFLIPKNISFSFWFFYLVYMVQILIMYWTGHIDTEGASQWWYLANVKTSQGAGAMLVFAMVVLFKCRQYVLCGLQPAALKGLKPDEQRELRFSSWLFLGASLAIILQLWLDMGANLFYTIFFYLVTLFMVVAMIRAVAEGGLLAVKTYINPFHYVRAFLGFDKGISAVPLFSPLLLYCGIFFLDLKVFIAPTMANALKLREDFKMRRGAFHGAILISILLAIVVSTITALMMSYDRGADNMSTWFYSSWPRSTFNTLTTIAKNPPGSSGSSALWMTVGGVATAAIIYLRQFLFWMPHPLGLVMLVNPMMQSYWFSIFLGWLANVAITKYGHQNTYKRATGFFIGLIAGELLIVILSVIVSIATGNNINIDLNRN